MKIKLLILVFLILTLSACNKVDKEMVSAKLQEMDEVQAMRKDPTSDELEEYCEKMGGFYETWSDGEVFCMMGNYGCDPEELYNDRCGVGI